MTMRRIFLAILLQLCLHTGANLFADAQESAGAAAQKITIPTVLKSP